ncbi:unnamed protein product, partial [Polarella glacialis]
ESMARLGGWRLRAEWQPRRSRALARAAQGGFGGISEDALQGARPAGPGAGGRRAE